MSLRNKVSSRPSYNRRLALLKQWRALFDVEPPLRIGAALLAMMITQKKQESIVASTFRALEKDLALSDQLKSSAAQPKSTLRLGDRIVRGWGGTNHEVIILKKGFSYRGEVYRSLSEIARFITGVRWSGPRFFGTRETSS